jgi:hypothetical protein
VRDDHAIVMSEDALEARSGLPVQRAIWNDGRYGVSSVAPLNDMFNNIPCAEP